MRTACKLCAELGFDGIDINMGCPDRTIEKQGCGSAMIKTPDAAIEIIRAARQGIADAGKSANQRIPLSVKTRVGYNRDEIETWIACLLGEKLDALTVHARTRKDLSQVPANWNYISRVVKLRNELSPETVILGNGDISSMNDGIEKAKKTGADGIMIGRALFGNPWIFNSDVSIKKQGSWRQGFFLRMLPTSWAKKIMGDSRYTISDIPLEQKLGVMVEHTRLFEKMLGDVKNFAVMKKHYKAYATGFPGAKELRIKLMETKNGDEVEQFVAEFLGK
jgi:tRNA-dihydrouridine synthase